MAAEILRGEFLYFPETLAGAIRWLVWKLVPRYRSFLAGISAALGCRGAWAGLRRRTCRQTRNRARCQARFTSDSPRA